MSDVSPFRLFGRAADPRPGEPGADVDPAPWTAGRTEAEPAPATRHARPVAFGRGTGLAPVDDDPLTDPYGFPPVRDAPVERPRPRPVPAMYAAPPPDPLEAAALAGAFAADYLSWNEDDPGRRGRALADHLAVPVPDPALLGWDGRGRQRAEFALPGLVRADGDDRVLVDVRVRVTPYREVGGADERAVDRLDDAAEGTDPHVPGVPAAAPAPTGRGWRGGASYWVRLSVPVVREDGRLGVDATDEATELADEPGVPEDVAERGVEERSGTPGTTGSDPEDRPLLPVPRRPESAW